jgi:molybdenum cofactor synthesis domain-containing protein
LVDLCDRRVDLVITIGGTGICARDVALEATRNVIDRELAGLAESMRTASAEEAPNALLLRAIAGARRETLIVNLSGRLNSAMEELDAILPVLPSAVQLLRGGDKSQLVTLESGAASGHHPLSTAEV